MFFFMERVGTMGGCRYIHVCCFFHICIYTGTCNIYCFFLTFILKYKFCFNAKKNFSVTLKISFKKYHLLKMKHQFISFLNQLNTANTKLKKFFSLPSCLNQNILVKSKSEIFIQFLSLQKKFT